MWQWDKRLLRMPVRGDVCVGRSICRLYASESEDKNVQDQKIQSLKELRCQGMDIAFGQEFFQLLGLSNQ